jgi:tetratricopeptide (TPR) repeat protein
MRNPILRGMNRCARHLLFATSLILAATVRAETETIDLKALAKKARPAVMLLVVSDADGKEIATGTGFLVSSDGKLITNHHVIEGAASIVAKAENGGLFPVEGVLADDPKNDLVLLKLKGKDLPFLTLGSGDTIEVGTRIAIIGSPLGLEGTLSEGIVSAIRELMGDMKMLQVTAAISPGSSGSPVLNAKGEVVGIASAVLKGGQGLSFAEPVECGIRLMANVKPSSVPHPLSQSANEGIEDATLSDSDWRGLCAADASEDYVEMLKRAKSLVGHHPDSALAYWALGEAFNKLDFTDDEIAAYRQAIKINPDFSRPWIGLGTAYYKSKRTDDAITACRQAVKLDPDDFQSWCILGIALDGHGRTDDAINAYRQAVRIKPESAPVWYVLARACHKSGRTEDAIAACRQSVQFQPDDVASWRELGEVYAISGRTDDAIAAVRRAVEIKPDDLRAWILLASVYEKSGQVEDAIDAYRQAIKALPDEWLLWFSLWRLYKQIGNTEESAYAFQRARELGEKIIGH